MALTRDEDRAHDLVQDTCTAALDNARRFKPGTNLRAWLFTIMHNRHVSHIRRESRAGPHLPLADESARLAQPSTQVWRLEFRDLVAALDQLDEQFREVLILVTVEGLSYQDVADILDIPVGTVTSRLSRARSMLRSLLESGEERPPADTARPAFRVIK